MPTIRKRPATNARTLALGLLVFAPLAILFAVVPPIAQDPTYHLLADQRTCLRIPNFANVVSSAAFLAAGLMGLCLTLGRGVGGAARAWTVFFLGVALVAPGSAYYHWSPDDASLAWDRLPMTVAFTALATALFAEHVRPAAERGLLVIALAVGIGSVVWWRYTGDLRLYAWVQFAPLVALAFIAFAFPARYSHRHYLLLGLAAYAAAKLAEWGDVWLFEATGGAVSGHTTKHLLAALATWCVYRMLRRRGALP